MNSDLEAVVTVPVSGPAGRFREVEAVIDTGFSGILTLPPALVDELRLPEVGEMEVTLADGSETIMAVHDATVLWDDRSSAVTIEAADTTPLVGMALLEGHNLNVDVHRGGRVLITSGQTA